MYQFSKSFFGDDNKEINDDLEVSYDTNIFEDEVLDVNISQPLMQEDTLRQVEDIFIAIKFKCEEGGQQLAQHTHVIFIQVLADIH